MDPVPDPILPEKFLGYSRESNPAPVGWQSDVLTTIPNRRLLNIVILGKWKMSWYFLSRYTSFDAHISKFTLTHSHCGSTDHVEPWPPYIYYTKPTCPLLVFSVFSLPTSLNHNQPDPAIERWSSPFPFASRSWAARQVT